MNVRKCKSCGCENEDTRYFCKKCGSFLYSDIYTDKSVYEKNEIKMMRIISNIKNTPHTYIPWDNSIDIYVKKIEELKALYSLPEMDSENNMSIFDKMDDFLKLCYKPEFQIAFVGTIKTGKSTLINALLGKNYASMAVTPETAALTKFRSSPRDYVDITFYTKKEWNELWASISSGADTFMNEYNDLQAEKYKNKWVGHEKIHSEMENSEIEAYLHKWSSSQSPEHYFVKEVEVGISNLPKDFPGQVMFVDTPGLSDPVAYRSEITKKYIKSANAVFVCVDANKLEQAEIVTLSTVFSLLAHNKERIHIIATRYDTLNNPLEGWKQQKRHWLRQLVGKGFFDDRQTAEKNIVHCAAHIYNLARDIETLNMDDMTTLYGVLFKIMAHTSGKLSYMPPDELKKNAALFKKFSNVEIISNIIKKQLVRNYKKLISQDIENKYYDITYNLKRIAEETNKDYKKLIKLSPEDKEKIEREIEKMRKNYNEVSDAKAQLLKVLDSVNKNTNARLKQVLPMLESFANEQVKR